MLFDTTRFPLVFLKEDPQADSHDTDTEAQLARLLAVSYTHLTLPTTPYV